MQNQRLDRKDAAIAASAGIAVVVWGVVVAYPFPHASAWASLVDAFAKVGFRVPLWALGILGKCALGISVAFVYLAMRAVSVELRDFEDDEGDPFFFSRCTPLVLTLSVALCPYAWRSFQFLSPDSALVSGVAVLASLCVLSICMSNILLRLLCGILLGGLCGYDLLVVPVVAFLKAVEIKVNLRRPAEGRQGASDWLVWTLPLCATFASAWYFGRTPQAWWARQSELIGEATRSPLVFSTVLAPFACAVALVIGLALRRRGDRARPFTILFTALVGCAGLFFVCHSFARSERSELRLVRDYARLMVSITADARWVFTDGRLDDAIRLVQRERGSKSVLLSVVSEPSERERKMFLDSTPDPVSRELLRHGGLEVLKSWARERPQDLAACAWQFGSNVLERHGVKSVAAGPVMVEESPARQSFVRDACAHTDSFVAQVAAELPRLSDHSACLDAVLWRLARYAEQKGDREQALAFYRENKTLGAERVAAFERLVPSSVLVLTPRESLNIALQRADFALAERYARIILSSSRNDLDAIFAMSMISLDREDYRECIVYSERYLADCPDEPSVLNNLSLAYYKVGEIEKAVATAEKAAALMPERQDVKKNLEFLRSKIQGPTAE